MGAEGEGFEPPVAYATPVFKTGAIGRSATPPSAITSLAEADTVSKIFSQQLGGTS
jgi:hypothetical protein